MAAWWSHDKGGTMRGILFWAPTGVYLFDLRCEMVFQIYSIEPLMLVPQRAVIIVLEPRD